MTSVPSRQPPHDPSPGRGVLLDIWPSTSPAPLAADPRNGRPRPNGDAAAETHPDEMLFGLLEHVSTLSSLVAASSRVSSARLDALEAQVARGMAEVRALRRLMQEELATRPPLSDHEVSRIAEAVSARLTSRGDKGAAPGPRSTSRPAA